MATTNWQAGPLPAGTYDWGGVVLVGEEGKGFHFADFCGDHVILCPGGRRVEPADVAVWNNSLCLPPHVATRANPAG